MSNKDKIFNLLQEKELTNKEIAKELDLSINEVRVYVNRLKKEKKVKSIGKKERYKIYKTINKTIENNMKNRLLHDRIDKIQKENKELKNHIKFLMDFFQDNKKVLQNKAYKHKDKFKQIIEVLN